MIEVIGIIAGCFVLISFLFNKTEQIRCVNIIGCILFIVYGVLIKSISVLFLNSFTLIINILYLLKRKK